jgi:hypothetical protein
VLGEAGIKKQGMDAMKNDLNPDVVLAEVALCRKTSFLQLLPETLHKTHELDAIGNVMVR